MKLRIPFLDLGVSHQLFQGELESKFKELIAKGIFSGGVEVDAFAKEVGDYLRAPYVIPCSNGTDALEIALKVLGVRPGDEVIVPALTWVSTAEAVLNVGAVPKFVDVTTDGLMDVEMLASKYYPKATAILPVHLYGKMVDMKLLNDLAGRNGWKVVEDAAQAFGSFSARRSAGLWGQIGCFSFYPTKNLGALGEAGMLVTKDPELAAQLHLWVNHGQESRNVHLLSGRNAKIDTLQAAFLRVKLRHFPTMQAKRKMLAAIYLEHLKGISDIILPKGILEQDHNAHLFTIHCEQRDRLKAYLEKEGIGSAIHYPQILPRLAPFQEEGNYPVAEQLVKTTLSLPLHPALTEDEVQEVCSILHRFFN